MITIVEIRKKALDGTAVFELRGKSTDTKPTGFYQEAKVGNGSSFMEMDTGDVYMFDGGANRWLRL